MCGISALITRDLPAEELRAAVEHMTLAQVHRGPDHSAVWCDDRIGLGHNRLRILDPQTRSDQPFFTHDGDGSPPVLVYNGEIYNHRELRSTLESLGERFRTRSDTEVLYRALRVWGPQAVEHLEGMFAFVFYEPARRRLLVARDRIGIKPLFVYRSPGTTMIASDIHAFFASGFAPAEFDPAAIHQVSRFNHLLGERTAFENCSLLPPGVLLQVDLGSGSERSERYAELRLDPTPTDNYGKHFERLNEAFSGAVRSHLVADVQIGTFLSGGIDSTALTFEAGTQTEGALSTYSLTFAERAQDESPHIEQALRFMEEKELLAQSNKVPVNEATFDEYVHYIRHAQMPQLWTTDLAVSRLCKAASDNGHKVVLSGEGPDELFAGYDSFRTLRLRQVLERTGILSLMAHLPQAPLQLGSLSWFRVDTAMLRFYARAHLAAKQESMAERYGFHPENVAVWNLLEASCAQLVRPELLETWPAHREVEAAQFARFFARHPKDLNTFQKNLVFELGMRLPSWVLLMADRMSSAHGLELRVPYLDQGFVSAALRLPDRHRLRGLREKYILKELHRSRVPRSIYKRRKQALYTPISEWVAGFRSSASFERYWSPEAFDRLGYFNFAAAEQVARRVEAARYSSFLEQLTMEWSFMLVLSTQVSALEAHAVAGASATNTKRAGQLPFAEAA